MSTSEEVREQPPEPIEVIENFLGVNRTFLDFLDRAQANPSLPVLASADEQVLAARDAITTLHEKGYFGDSEHTDDMNTAVDSVMVAITEVVQRTHKINPEYSKDVTFAPDFREEIINGLQDSREAAAVATKLSNTYGTYIHNAKEALITSDRIIDFTVETRARLEQRKRFRLYAGVATAAFAGTLLASQINRRK